MAQSVPGDRRLPVYLVVEKHSIVADDLIETIGAFNPAARIVRAATSEDALRALARLPALTVAVLSMPLADLRSSGLADRIRGKAGRIILIDTCGSDGMASIPADWRRLYKPFTADMIVAELLSAGVHPGA